ncbi:Pleckstrin y domain-containing G member 4B [Balamuthia mandrillaris]
MQQRPPLPSPQQQQPQPQRPSPQPSPSLQPQQRQLRQLTPQNYPPRAPDAVRHNGVMAGGATAEERPRAGTWANPLPSTTTAASSPSPRAGHNNTALCQPQAQQQEQRRSRTLLPQHPPGRQLPTPPTGASPSASPSSTPFIPPRRPPPPPSASSFDPGPIPSPASPLSPPQTKLTPQPSQPQPQPSQQPTQEPCLARRQSLQNEHNGAFFRSADALLKGANYRPHAQTNPVIPLHQQQQQTPRPLPNRPNRPPVPSTPSPSSVPSASSQPPSTPSSANQQQTIVTNGGSQVRVKGKGSIRGKASLRGRGRGTFGRSNNVNTKKPSVATSTNIFVPPSAPPPLSPNELSSPSAYASASTSVPSPDISIPLHKPLPFPNSKAQPRSVQQPQQLPKQPQQPQQQQQGIFPAARMAAANTATPTSHPLRRSRSFGSSSPCEAAAQCSPSAAPSSATTLSNRDEGTAPTIVVESRSFIAMKPKPAQEQHSGHVVLHPPQQPQPQPQHSLQVQQSQQQHGRVGGPKPAPPPPPPRHKQQPEDPIVAGDQVGLHQNETEYLEEQHNEHELQQLAEQGEYSNGSVVEEAQAGEIGEGEESWEETGEDCWGEDEYEREDGSYAFWGGEEEDDLNYYLGYWGEDGHFHEGYWDENNNFWEGYWGEDGSWHSVPEQRSWTSSGATNNNHERCDGRGRESIGEEPNAKDDPNRQMKNVLKEILTTEREYVTSLKFIVEEYQRPLEKLGLLSPSELATVFGSINIFRGVNESLLDTIEKWYAGTSTESIGGIFSQVTPYLKMYSQYVNNYEKQEQELARLLKERKEFRLFCDAVKARPESHQLELSSLLIRPVQRVCKYPLLFKELVKCTPKDSADYPKLEKVLEMVTRVADHVNSMKAHSEGLKKMLDIQARLEGSFTIVTSSRSFIKEGKFKVILPPLKEGTTNVEEKEESNREKDKVLSSASVFLFSDSILIASARRGKSRLKMKRFLILDALFIIRDCELPSSSSLSLSASLEDLASFSSSPASSDATCSTAFELVDKNGVEVLVLRMIAPDVVTKQDWMSEISRVIANKSSSSVSSSMSPLMEQPGSRISRRRTVQPGFGEDVRQHLEDVSSSSASTSKRKKKEKRQSKRESSKKEKKKEKKQNKRDSAKGASTSSLPTAFSSPVVSSSPSSNQHQQQAGPFGFSPMLLQELRSQL